MSFCLWKGNRLERVANLFPRCEAENRFGKKTLIDKNVVVEMFIAPESWKLQKLGWLFQSQEWTKKAHRRQTQMHCFVLSLLQTVCEIQLSGPFLRKLLKKCARLIFSAAQISSVWLCWPRSKFNRKAEVNTVVCCIVMLLCPCLMVYGSSWFALSQSFWGIRLGWRLWMERIFALIFADRIHSRFAKEGCFWKVSAGKQVGQQRSCWKTLS